MVKSNDRIHELTKQNEELKSQLSESQETLRAIQAGEVDALVVRSPSGEHVYTLKDAEHPYRVMVETMNEGAATLAADGTVFCCNSQLADLLKVKINKLISVPLTNFVIPDQIAAFQSLLKQASCGTIRAEIGLNRSDGAVVPVLVSARSLNEENRHMVSLVITDLSEHKHTEQIVASEKFARTILEQAADAIVVCDIGGTIIRASEKAQNLIGIDLEGWKFDQVFDHFYPVSSGNEPLTPLISCKPLNLAALNRDGILSGSEIALVLNGCIKQSFILNFSLLSEQDNVIGYSIALTDVTVRKQAEEDLKITNLELASANKELESFSYSISHDLRAPLRTINGFSRIILDEYSDKLDESGKGYLNSIHAASEHMAALIDDILRLSRLNRAEMYVQEVDLSEEVRSISELLKKSRPERKAEFVITPKLTVQGDRSLLTIALQNLLDNAWKYSGKCPQTRVEFGAIEQKGEQVYFIKDNGAGFDMVYSDKLFQPFQRLHSAEEFEGNGIGLAIVQRVIRRHRGRVWAESEKGRGATFYFTLGHKTTNLQDAMS
jgi:PAS domain S-box-containing protein